jgi:ABC-type multidrug transport system fused ATPase/permease subunit
VLENQSFAIKRGALHHLHSPSGSGKTTTLRLIAGLLAPSRGKVTVFGIEAQRASDVVLYVPQHCGLFEASIRENLELLSGAELPEIDRAAELTGLRHLLQKFPMGVETRVAAQGQNLSSGQRQLIVLTAAFASPRPILLLDEATSQIDVEMRGRIDWDALRRGRTIVRVEHG